MRVLLTALVIALALAAPTRADNIIINPSFETWLDSLGVHLPTGWLSSELTWPGTAERTSQSHTGDYAVKLAGNDTSAFVSTVTIVSAGADYRFAGWAHVPGILGGSFVLEWFKLLGGAIGGPTLIPAYFSTGYREYGRSLTAPDSARFLMVSFATLPGANAYLDDVTVSDTVLGGVEEPSSGPAPTAEPAEHVCKVLGSSLLLDSIEPGARVYDAVGRRVRSQSRVSPFGVYFVVPRSRVERH